MSGDYTAGQGSEKEFPRESIRGLADKAKRLKELARTCRAWDGPHNWSVFDAAVDDALRDLAIPAGEAVAWIARREFDYWRKNSHRMWGPAFFAEQEGEDRIPLYASPQPTPEASQDGGGATRPKILAIDDSECMVGGGVVWPTVAVNLRPPLPGRESTAQAAEVAYRWRIFENTPPQDTGARLQAHQLLGCAIDNLAAESAVQTGTWPGGSYVVRGSTAQAGAGEAMYLDEERDTDRRMAYNEGYQDGLFAQSKAAAPSVLAMREALQGALDLVNGRAFGKNASTATMSKRWLAWEKRAEAALASTLPEPRAGETEPEPPAGCACVLTLSEGMLDAAIRALMWAPTEGNRTRLRGGLEAALAAATPSPIATPKPQERKPLTEDVLRDAARYRFIRDADRSDFNGTSFDTIMRYAMEDLDILVDEAIERERAHGIVPQDGDRGEGEGS